MIVTVTGGTGFLGSAVVRRLVERGDTVRVVVRPTSLTRHLPAGITTCSADINDANQMRDALAGSDAVVHAAAVVSNWGHRWPEFERVNIDAPAVVCRAATDAGVKRIVYVSSFLALGPSGETDAVDENTIQRDRHFHNHYERSKAMGAERVRRLAENGLPVVTVFPGMLYGPGPDTEGNYVGRILADYVAGRVPGIIGDGRQRWSFAHVDDVAAGIALAIDRAQPGSRYVLGGENVSLNDLFALLGAITGVAPPTRHVGSFAAWLAGLWFEIGGWFTGRAPALTRDAAAITMHHWACDSSAA